MAVVSNLPAIAGDTRHGFDPGVGKIPWRRAWQSTPAFLPGESHGQRSLAGYSPRHHTESDAIEGTYHTGTHLGYGDHLLHDLPTAPIKQLFFE